MRGLEEREENTRVKRQSSLVRADKGTEGWATFKPVRTSSIESFLFPMDWRSDKEDP